ncbi:hypothetical protein [Streptomyces sp. NPDC059224]|uniref:allene oxide cyclase barrel-like domain-containing protein n=1 Tax=Streptomyces sp. NPDC059224 TaxID=3346775 RepID=UPI0036974C4A
MRKISLRPLVPAAAAAAVLVSTPPASAAAEDTHQAHRAHQAHQVHQAHQSAGTFQLVARQTQSQSIDAGKKGHSLGDQLVIAEDLYRNGKKIGDHAVVCTYVHIGPDTLQCLGTFSLPQGQISGQALLHLPSRSAVDVAVTGGSGAYSGTGGYVHTAPAGTTERHLTFHLSD